MYEFTLLGLVNSAVLQIAMGPALTIYVPGPHAVQFVLTKPLIDVRLHSQEFS